MTKPTFPKAHLMAETTGIAWTDSSFNPWLGCSKISPGCDHCYAEVSTPSRAMRIAWGPHEERHRTSVGNWRLPLRWNAGHARFAAEHGRKRRVFCASLADVFDNRADPSWRADLWALVRATPHLDWLLLTKRIGNVAAMLPADWGSGYPNVWLGISVVTQHEADRDVPRLLATPAAIRWLSMEPLLGPLSLRAPRGLCGQRLDWVIVGGESGPYARPMLASWVSDIREQCTELDIAFFFKQWGGTAKDKGGCLLGAHAAKAWPATAQTT
jgi:protein gp37